MQAGEVWIVDLGIAAKVRPVLVLTPPPSDRELALVTFVQHTTATRGDNPWEIRIPKPWLRDGAFHLQQVNSVAIARFERRLGSLTAEEFSTVKKRLGDRFGL
jgi:mRNA interferase MazF